MALPAYCTGYANLHKHAALIVTDADQLSLHTADPTATGAVAECSGGSPAYARKAVTVTRTGNVLALGAAAVFDVANQTPTHWVLWDGSVAIMRGSLGGSYPISGQGTLTVSNLPLTVAMATA